MGSSQQGFNRDKFREVCERSGFNKKELAEIYGVSRQTVYDWLNGKSEPFQHMLVLRARHATTALLTAIERKILPLSPTLAQSTRQVRIDAIVKVILESMKPGKA